MKLKNLFFAAIMITVVLPIIYVIFPSVIGVSIGLLNLGVSLVIIFILHYTQEMLVYNSDRLSQTIDVLKKEILDKETRLQVLEELTLPKQIAVYLETAAQLEQEGKLRAARDICLKGTTIFPNSKPLWIKLSKVVELMGNFSEAALHLKKAESLAPKDFELLYHLGDLLFQAGLYSEAINYYEKALKLGKDGVDIYLNKGEALVKIGKLAEAMAWYSKALQVYPDSLELRSNRAKVYLELGEYTICLKETNQILKRDPDFTAARYNKACCLCKIGELNYAKQELLMAIQSDRTWLEKAKNDPDLGAIQGHLCQGEAFMETENRVEPVKIETVLYSEH
jgi:tetratricopeptide (TPR) repeat protein